MKRSIVSIPITRLGDGKPSILRIQLSEVTHFLQVTLHVNQHPLHWCPYRTQKPRRYKRRRSPCRRRLPFLVRRRPRWPLTGRSLYLRCWSSWCCWYWYQLCLWPLLHSQYSLTLSDLSLSKKAWKVEKPQNEEVALRVCVNVTVSLLLTQWGVYIYSAIVLSSSSSSLFYNLLTTVSLCVSIRLSTIKNYNAHCFCFFFQFPIIKNF